MNIIIKVACMLLIGGIMQTSLSAQSQETINITDSLNQSKALTDSSLYSQFEALKKQYMDFMKGRIYLEIPSIHVGIIPKELLKRDEILQNMADILFKLEESTAFESEVSPTTRALIALHFDPLHIEVANIKNGVLQNDKQKAAERNTRMEEMIALLKRVELKVGEDRKHDLFLRTKLLKELGNTIRNYCRANFSSYTYAGEEKKLIKFIHISTGNDLFTVAGLSSSLFMGAGKDIKDGRTVFQRNDDRSYTGSLLVEVGTDYLNTRRRRPIKTYQTFLYGFDVHTPYFKDSVVFSSDTSHNPLDQPHGNFEYFGWSKQGLSIRGNYRWRTALKFGKIGGKRGESFQTALHQDISYSPRPKGWGAQVANGGRIGISLEMSQEFLQYQLINLNSSNCDDKTSSFGNLYSSFIAEERIGTYITDFTLGLRLSNKSFSENNHHFMNRRTRQTVCGKFQHLMYEVAWRSGYVVHNTMLEGYGLFKTREKESDAATPLSTYYLNSDQIQRLKHALTLTVSYTSRFATFYYRWNSFSPETNLEGIGIISPASGKELTLKNRWHHFAILGVIFQAE